MFVPTRFLTVVLAVVVAAFAAPAGAALDPDHKTSYQAKLRYYDSHMDVEIAFTDNWIIATESHATTLAEALSDPDQQDQIPMIEVAALQERELLQEGLAKFATKMRRDMARFRENGVSWFSKKWERRQFRSYLATAKSGFERLWEADQSVSAALLAVSNSDVAGAREQLQLARVDLMSGEKLYDHGVRGLRSLM